jgi:histone deacetylase complex subunit SAP30
MARAKNKRRIRREELAMIVRRNFKEAPVVENECVVTLLYKVQMKGMALRSRSLQPCTKLTIR